MPALSPAPSLLNFWGKAQPVSADGPRWHPLPYHSLDVACVTAVYLERNPSVMRALCEATDWPADQVQRLCYFLACAHDLGKAHPGFQSKAPELFAAQFPGRVPVTEPLHHSQAGLGILVQWLASVPAVLHAQDTGESLDSLTDRLEPLLNAACGHHGRPQDLGASALRPAWSAPVLAYMDEAQQLFGEDLVAQVLALSDAQLRKASTVLAGVITLCDWVGSSQEFFPYVAPSLSLALYAESRARNAQRALDSLGLAEKPACEQVGFGFLFPALANSPSPLQAYADSVALAPAAGPTLFILEDETGAGKTEAALALASRLVGQGAGRGVAYTLPTQTTANAIFQRISGVAEGFFSPGSRPSLVLRHGASQAALRSMLATSPEMGAISSDLNSWASDSSKTSLLADFGVCTIDQVVLSALPTKHFVLRQLGLAHKVLVVDEAHACEPYLLELLASALRIHARNGGSAILLSATLPREAKGKLLAAFAEGAGLPRPAPCARAYPLASALSRNGLVETPVSARRAPRRLDFEPLQEADITALVSTWLQSGKCVAVIRNTVRSAQETFDQFEALFPGRCELVHAKFVARHRDDNDKRLLGCFGKSGAGSARRGRLVIATQVVEQSLDVDFDELVTDLAPLDALLQRAGRRRRHLRDLGGNCVSGEGAMDAREPGPVYVVMPAAGENTEFLGELPAHTAFVYPMPGVLWRTAEYLQTHKGLVVPDQVREAVDYAYASDIEPPAFLLDAELDSDGKVRAARQKARFVAIDPALGYSCQLKSLSSAECVTRLGEPSVKVVLCDAHGTPLFGDKEGSRLSLRASLLDLEQGADGNATLRMQKAGLAEWVAAVKDIQGRNRQATYSLQRGLQVSGPL